MDTCIEKIIENEAIDGIIVGPTVYSMSCFAPIIKHANQNNLPIIVPHFSLTYANIDRLTLPPDSQRFLVFGGGKLTDFVKVYASRNHISLIVLLSSVSNDGFASSFSSLRPNEQSYNQSYPSQSPQSVYACLPLLDKHMPHKLWLSGLGELFSKLNVWEDLKIDDQIKDINRDLFGEVKQFANHHAQRNENSLTELVERLYSFSILMRDDSRWCSRSEHEFEKLYAGSGVSHGQLVLMGALVAMKIRCLYQLPHSYELLLYYCRKFEMNIELKEEFELMLQSGTYKRMGELSAVRPERFGLWNLIDSESVDWRQIVREISAEL